VKKVEFLLNVMQTLNYKKNIKKGRIPDGDIFYDSAAISSSKPAYSR